MAENKKKDSIIVTESGLQYKIIKLGTGPKPVSTDKVKTHRDNLDGIEVYKHKSGGYDVNHTMNANGKNGRGFNRFGINPFSKME